MPLAAIDIVDMTDAIVDAAWLEGRRIGELHFGTFNFEAKFSKFPRGCTFSATDS